MSMNAGKTVIAAKAPLLTLRSNFRDLCGNRFTFTLGNIGFDQIGKSSFVDRLVGHDLVAVFLLGDSQHTIAHETGKFRLNCFVLLKGGDFAVRLQNTNVGEAQRAPLPACQCR